LRDSRSDVNINTLGKKNRSTPHWVRRVAGEYLDIEVQQNILKDMR
jgi:hypothetical protein